MQQIQSCNHVGKTTLKTKVWEITKYIWRTRMWAISVALFALLSGSIYLAANDEHTLKGLAKGYFDEENLIYSLVQLITFVGVTGIWVGAIRQEWKNSLNKYLSVSFLYNGVLRVRCRYAKLVGEADARGMAQSFGQVLNCGRFELAPSLQEVHQCIEVDENKDVHEDVCLLINKGQPLLHYDVVLCLTQDVRVLCKKSNSGDDSSKTEIQKSVKGTLIQGEIEIPENMYLLWDYPFDKATENNLRKLDDCH